jgi:hypothetical protein
MNRLMGMLGLVLVVGVGLGMRLEAEPTSPAKSNAVGGLSARIDQHLAKRWAAENVTPAPLTDDATFLRRVSLDIVGKIPPVGETREFLADTDPDKRAKLVDRLLDSPAYTAHYAAMWRDILIPEAATNLEVRFVLPGFESWLKRKFLDNTAYDQLVRDLLTARIASETMPQPGPMNQLQAATPVGFYTAKQVKPENIAAAASRMFLGVRIECAQCHDHPFDTWKQEQFWSFSSFFAGLGREGADPDNPFSGAIKEVLERRELTIPVKGTVVQAAFLTGEKPVWKEAGPRTTLADWITSRDNPWFARALVNRMWGHFFGTGLIDPIDDFSSENKPSHPELLDELAHEFAAHDFDLKFLIRTIVNSRGYQLGSEQTHASQSNPRLFAKMSIKSLTPAQLFDSLARATGYFERRAERDQTNSFNNEASPRSQFLETFSDNSETSADQSTTILQALQMMNGQFIADSTSLERNERTNLIPSELLTAVVNFPLFTTAERIEALYLAALIRPPRPQEIDRMVKHFDSYGNTSEASKAYGDILWALLNSSEFLFNH